MRSAGCARLRRADTSEYEVEALVPSTGKIYRQMYAGRLVACDGKIELLREALDTVTAAKAFAMDSRH
ncbi:hypothetical protein [Paraburkholderia sp. J67]|uniref:hypothetical protein n=1 Tax=Paraburkholderia sp. J67 TaxID=2805435 RepID=UPI002ABD4B57|nr:hypothetical protein [Paraburkholderia sp. J67]